jgi:hypothetical protein
MLKRWNSGFGFFLLVINCFNKMVWVEPLKNKSGPEVLNAFNRIYKRTGTSFTHLQVDKGREFDNHAFKDYCKENNLNLYFSKTIKKAALAER